MKHFDAGAWADYVRNQVSGQQRLAMSEHLAHCSNCREVHRLLRSVNVVADSPEPALHMVELACQVFPDSTPADLDLPRLTLRRLPAIGTSELQLRRGVAAASHHRYQVNDLIVELQLQHEAGQPEATLVGVIGYSGSSPSGDSQIDLFGIPVYLLWKGKVLAQTSINELGEFLLEFELRSQLKLCVPLAQAGGRIEISLKRLLGL